MKTVQIAIDGPSASGKSTVAKLIAKENQFIYLDTGAMYRAFTWYALENQADLANEGDLITLLPQFNIQFNSNDGKQTVLVNGNDVSDVIRKEAVTKTVSLVSSHKTIRQFMVSKQQEIAGGQSIVMDGRDIGTKVLPNADLKFFLTADPLVRAKRRLLEFKGTEFSQTDLEAMLVDIKRRDKLDSTRSESPLIQAEDAYLIDSSDLSTDMVLQIIQNKIDQLFES